MHYAKWDYCLTEKYPSGRLHTGTMGATLSAALTELKHSLMAGRIMDARSEIISRMEKLQTMPGLHQPERQAIEDALTGLRFLEREDARYLENQHRAAAQAALEKLGSIGPAIDRLKDSTEEG
jgi:hypothetical protein